MSLNEAHPDGVRRPPDEAVTILEHAVQIEPCLPSQSPENGKTVERHVRARTQVLIRINNRKVTPIGAGSIVRRAFSATRSVNHVPPCPPTSPLPPSHTIPYPIHP